METEMLPQTAILIVSTLGQPDNRFIEPSTPIRMIIANFVAKCSSSVIVY